MLNDGGTVIYLDHESTPSVVVGRLLALGVDSSSLLDNGEVAAWMRRVPRALARTTGAAVVMY